MYFSRHVFPLTRNKGGWMWMCVCASVWVCVSICRCWGKERKGERHTHIEREERKRNTLHRAKHLTDTYLERFLISQSNKDGPCFSIHFVQCCVIEVRRLPMPVVPCSRRLWLDLSWWIFLFEHQARSHWNNSDNSAVKWNREQKEREKERKSEQEWTSERKSNIKREKGDGKQLRGMITHTQVYNKRSNMNDPRMLLVCEVGEKRKRERAVVGR